MNVGIGILSPTPRSNTVCPVPNPPGTAGFAAQRDGKQAIDDPLAGDERRTPQEVAAGRAAVYRTGQSWPSRDPASCRLPCAKRDRRGLGIVAGGCDGRDFTLTSGGQMQRCVRPEAPVASPYTAPRNSTSPGAIRARRQTCRVQRAHAGATNATPNRRPARSSRRKILPRRPGTEPDGERLSFRRRPRTRGGRPVVSS